MYSMEQSRPSIAWSLTVAARETCQSLGYHKAGRGSDGISNEPNHLGLLFWLVYVLEKTLSLRLGRASTITEQDVTVPPPGGTHPSCPLSFYLQLQVRLARLAGMVYTDLYSAHSLTVPEHSRRTRIQKLSHEVLIIQEATLANHVSTWCSKKDRSQHCLY